MALKPTTERNLDGYGAPPLSWTSVRELLAHGVGQITQAPGTGGPARHTCWLATAGPDGRPHVRPVGVLFTDGPAYFNTGVRTQKAKNLARDARCALTVATHPFDLVVEGVARPVRDHAVVERVAELFTAAGWSPSARDGLLYAEYSAPSAGPPPWQVYEMVPTSVHAFATAEPSGATRWTVEDEPA